MKGFERRKNERRKTLLHTEIKKLENNKGFASENCDG
jgi:hypothetical protein